jgi:hypothetical protein
MREHIRTSAALPSLSYRAEPDFDAAMSILAGHADAVTVLRPVGVVWRDYASGLAHLGLGHTTTAMHHLRRAVRLSDRIGFTVGTDQFVVALAIAHGQAGGLALCGTLAGYARQHCAPTMVPIHTWFDRHLGELSDRLGAAEWKRATDAGVQLDRRSFIHLIGRAEQDLLDRIDPGST